MKIKIRLNGVSNMLTVQQVSTSEPYVTLPESTDYTTPYDARNNPDGRKQVVIKDPEDAKKLPLRKKRKKILKNPSFGAPEGDTFAPETALDVSETRLDAVRTPQIISKSVKIRVK